MALDDSQNHQIRSGSRGFVYIVEDSLHTRNIFNYLFRKNGFEVVSFKNATEAWQFMKEGKQHNLRLVLSDIMMPGMSGLELIERMRAHGEYKDVAAVLLTAISDREAVEKAKALDVKAYVLKPVSASKVVECLRRIFPDEDFIEFKIGK